MKKVIFSLFTLVYITSATAQGAYIEFKLSSNNQVMGSMVTYYQDGNTRTESKMEVPRMGGAISFTLLFLKATPSVSYRLNDADKTYTESDRLQDDVVQDKNEYEVTVIGKEKLNGYNATHVKVKIKGGTTEREFWTSTEVPNYAKYKEINNKYTSVGVYKALAANGADGFPVRISTDENGHKVQIDMVKSEVRNNPASLFSLNGYTKTAKSSGTVYGQASQEMLKQMQNLTPEQRQKIIDEMKNSHPNY